MKRIPIRDNRSKEKIKPRVVDYLQDEDGQELLEIKDNKIRKTILLDDFLDQIETARKE